MVNTTGGRVLISICPLPRECNNKGAPVQLPTPLEYLRRRASESVQPERGESVGVQRHQRGQDPADADHSGHGVVGGLSTLPSRADQAFCRPGPHLKVVDSHFASVVIGRDSIPSKSRPTLRLLTLSSALTDSPVCIEEFSGHSHGVGQPMRQGGCSGHRRGNWRAARRRAGNRATVDCYGAERCEECGRACFPLNINRGHHVDCKEAA